MRSGTADVVVIGAGVVGAACAYDAARAGLSVVVVERSGVAGGSTGAGEGNLLISDKEPGPELALAQLSGRLWREIAAEIGAHRLEFETKGGLVVAVSDVIATGLAGLATTQRAAGVEVIEVSAAELRDLEPRMAHGLVGGAFYPGDAQLQPMRAAAELLAHSGARMRTGTEVTAIAKDAGGRVNGVQTTAGPISAAWVINAAGTWGGAVAALAGAPIPVLPRRGFVLVTEPLPPVIRHKVYAADYVANVASSAADLQNSVVVEGTASGTVLIGASRERVGFDRSVSVPVLSRLAAQAVALFPFLSEVSLLRSYLGFRPYCPDHLPVIGPDPRAPGLIHACGHEGAGIGLAAATGRLVTDVILGRRSEVDLRPFRPERFVAA